jgi:hypothetical protein
MRRSRITALVLLTAVITGKVGITQPADESALQGTWEVVAVERGGSADGGSVGQQLTFAGNVVSHHAAGMPLDGSVWALANMTVTLAAATPMDPAKLRAMVVY